MVFDIIDKEESDWRNMEEYPPFVSDPGYYKTWTEQMSKVDPNAFPTANIGTTPSVYQQLLRDVGYETKVFDDVSEQIVAWPNERFLFQSPIAGLMRDSLVHTLVQGKVLKNIDNELYKPIATELFGVTLPPTNMLMNGASFFPYSWAYQEYVLVVADKPL